MLALVLTQSNRTKTADIRCLHSRLLTQIHLMISSIINQAMISVPCKINGSKICKNVRHSACYLSHKSVKISSLCIVADDVDILGIFLKSFGAVIVFFCLAATICHSLRRGCFSKKGHNENK